MAAKFTNTRWPLSTSPAAAKKAEPLTSKDSGEVAKAFQTNNKRSPLTWPQMLQVDPGGEFMGSVTNEMENHKTYVRRGCTEIHRDQAIVERFNRMLAERLFGHQYAVEMLLPSPAGQLRGLKDFLTLLRR